MDWETEFWRLFEAYDQLWRFVADSVMDPHGLFFSPEQLKPADQRE